MEQELVNETHQAQLVEYVNFVRRKRDQCISEVAAEFKELKESRLFEDSYSQEDVENMLNGLLAVVRSNMGKELKNSSHSGVLLLKQVMEQCEKKKVNLDIDLPSTEDGKLLAAVSEWEAAVTSGGAGGTLGVKASIKKPAGQALPSVAGATDPKLLKELDDLRTQNDSLMLKFQKLQTQCTSILKDKTAANNELTAAKAEVESLKSSKGGDDSVDALRAKIAGLESELKSAKETPPEAVQVPTGVDEADIKAAQAETEKVKTELAQARAEMDSRLEKSKQFQNMKTMIQKKNQQVKELRDVLKKNNLSLDDIPAADD